MLPTLKPMLATFSEPFNSSDYTYEIKWDGYRCLAYLDSSTKLISRNLKDFSLTFPELLQIHKKFRTPGVILDGELIAIRNGKPNFFELQKRGHMQNSKSINSIINKIPVVYVIFDLLFLNYQPIYNQPIEYRRSILKENLVYSDELILTDFITEKGKDYFDGVNSLGLEGVVAKKIGSAYIPGKRTKTWFKFKTRKTSAFIISGYAFDSNKDLHSLILGAYLSGNLHLFGSVSSGLNSKDLNLIKKELDKISTPICPFNQKEQSVEGIVWVKPIVVCDIEYLEFTDGLSLRDPVFKNFKPQLTPMDCEF